MKIVIVKYSSGNVQSVLFSLKNLGYNAIISDELDLIKNSDKVIIPGVGEARSAMEYFHQTGLGELIVRLTQPVLGICLGMQLLCKFSEENNTPCLGVFDIPVKKFRPPYSSNTFKVPHIGWNNLFNLQGKLFNGIHNEVYQYFVHSYYVPFGSQTIATIDYITPCSAALQKENFYGVQFHPEKSGMDGKKIIKNFLNL
ncbi:MAG: imidazole glycerol phosphate synthase subunit HisH [Candidatus Walczuchella monophlebidarum]